MCYTKLNIDKYGVDMKNNFNKSTIKYFLISFFIFVVILGACSIALFMHSLDYDFSNLVDNSTTTTENFEEESVTINSAKELTGKSNILFIIEKNDGLDFAFIVATDFEKQSMLVKCIDGRDNLNYQNRMLKFSSVYENYYEVGAKNAVFENYGIAIDKFVVFNEKQFEDVLSLFNGFSIDVKSDINYKSHKLNLTLSKGLQELSPDLTYKYLQISDNSTRENIVCGIIKSVLVTEYAEKSDKLFTSFVNLCYTDISVVDYSESIDTLKTYCNANDKFYPIAMEVDAK